MPCWQCALKESSRFWTEALSASLWLLSLGCGDIQQLDSCFGARDHDVHGVAINNLDNRSAML